MRYSDKIITITMFISILGLAATLVNAKPCNMLLNYSASSSLQKFVELKCRVNGSILTFNSSLRFLGSKAVIEVIANYSQNSMECEINGIKIVLERLNNSQRFTKSLPWHMSNVTRLFFANEPLHRGCFTYFNGSWLERTPMVSGIEFCEICIRNESMMLYNSKTCIVELHNASNFEIKPSIHLLGFPLMPVIIIRNHVPSEAVNCYLEITLGNITVVTSEKEFEAILGPQEIVNLVRTQGVAVNYSVLISYRLTGDGIPCRYIIEKREGKLSLLPYLGDMAFIIAVILFLLLMGALRFRKAMMSIDVDVV